MLPHPAALNAGMIASLVTAEAAPAVLPNLVFAQADIRLEDRRPIGKRIDGPITAATAGKRIGLEMK
jgi:hypothetical protein